MAKKIPLWITISMIAVLGIAAITLSYLALTGGEAKGSEGLPVKPELESLTEPINVMNSSRMLATTDGLVPQTTAETCKRPDTIEFSKDHGQSWRASASLVEAGATQVLRTWPIGQWLVQAAALDSNHDPQLYRTENLGVTWVGPWARDGTRSFDSAHRGALAINYSEDFYVAEHAEDNTCTGVGLLTLTSDAFTSGSIALTQPDDLGLLWVEDNFTTSTDMGTPWL